MTITSGSGSKSYVAKPKRSRLDFTLRKHAYSNILKILQSKKGNFQIKSSDIFNIPAQTNIVGTR